MLALVLAQLCLGPPAPPVRPYPWPTVFAANFLANVSWIPGGDFSHALKNRI